MNQKANDIAEKKAEEDAQEKVDESVAQRSEQEAAIKSPEQNGSSGAGQSPDSPDAPDTPETPDAPKTSDTPNTPETPNAPDAPETSAAPETPDARDTSETSESSDTPNAANGGAGRRKGRSWLTALLLFVLFAALAAAAGYFIFDISKGRKANETRLAALADGLDTLQQSHNDLTAGLARLAGRQAGIDEQLAGILRNLNSLHRQRGGDTGWQLAEVGYLFRIASLRLALARDADAAQAILLSADARLREIPDPALVSVREQLIGDINRLKSAARTDISGVALALGDLAEQADQLPLNLGPFAEEARLPDPASIDMENRWQRLVRSLWQELKSLLVISRKDSNSVALLAPRERFFLRHNLRLQLEAARLAVLMRDAEQLRDSAGACRDWLEEFFDTEDNRVRSAREVLEHAAALELDDPVPSIDATLTAFDEYMTRRGGVVAGGAARQ